MSLTLVAIARDENGLNLTYEEIVDDPRPFVLTVTPTHVAHQVSERLPISAAVMQVVRAGLCSQNDSQEI
jgi:hypothetical protein